MKKLIVFIVLLMSAVSFAQEPANTHRKRGANYCAIEGILNNRPLFGRVRVVDSGEDLKVRIVSSGENLRVRITEFPTTTCSEWEYVSSGEDFKIRFVESGEDLRVRFVDYAYPFND